MWSKVRLFDPTIWSSWILDRLIGHIFLFKMVVYGPKSKLKQTRYHQNTKTLIENFTLFFLEKRLVFRPTSHNKLYQLGKNWSDPVQLTQRIWYWLPLIKRARWDLPQFGRYKFFKERRHKIFNIASPSFRMWYLENHSSKSCEVRIFGN